jgi:hypothetical protein
LGDFAGFFGILGIVNDFRPDAAPNKSNQTKTSEGALPWVHSLV